ncbi:MAG: hypothetical protein M1335_05450 [Chloroflexi bacterium]|nr:hypothetical protein [Chloroflexota bacterium]
MLLKGAPSQPEIDAGCGFAGPAGKAMIAAFDALGISPLHLYGTNALKCRGGALDKCLRHLESELLAISPSVILAMGSLATEAASKALEQIDLPQASPSAHPPRPTLFKVSLDPYDALGNPQSKRALWHELRVIVTQL